MPYYDTSRYQIPHSLTPNADFAYNGLLTIELRPRAPTGLGHVLIEDATRRQYLSFTADLALSVAVTGLGGIHDTYAPVAANTAYDIRAAWDPSSAELNGDFGLFAVPSGTVVNLALVQALSGTGDYSMWSPVLFNLFTNAGSQVIPFTAGLDGWTVFTDRVRVLNDGAAIIGTAIDCSAVVPDVAGCAVRWSAYAESSGVADRQVTVFQYIGMVTYIQQTLGALANIAGSVKSATTSGTCYMRSTPAELLYYVWDAAPSLGLDLWIDAIHL